MMDLRRLLGEAAPSRRYNLTKTDKERLTYVRDSMGEFADDLQRMAEETGQEIILQIAAQARAASMGVASVFIAIKQQEQDEPRARTPDGN